jgi:hypothetical protein
MFAVVPGINFCQMPVDILGGCSDRSLPTPAITEGSIRSRVPKVGFNEAKTLIASNIYDFDKPRWHEVPCWPRAGLMSL